jgi:hypothetical protein
VHQQSRRLGLILSLIGLCLACTGAEPPNAPAAATPNRTEVGTPIEPLPPWLGDIHRALQRTLSSPSLPEIEPLLYSTVVITSYAHFTNETLDQIAAAAWLREHARPELRVKQLLGHHHQPVVLAVTDGWSLDASESGCLTFYFHRYAPADAPDEPGAYWWIDVITLD